MASSYVTANGAQVTRGTLVRPRIGAWHADLTVDCQEERALDGPIEIVVSESLRFKGAARRAGLHLGTAHVLVVGGAGRLGTVLTPRSWVNAPIRLVLADALGAAGEELSPRSDPQVLGTLLPKWARTQRTAGQEIGELVRQVRGAAWRVLPDGAIWVGRESWPKAELAFSEIRFEPARGRLEVGADMPDVSPGQVLAAEGAPYDGRRVSSVEHGFSASEVRHVLFLEDSEDSGADRLKAGLESYLDAKFKAKIDHLAAYWAVVLAQNGDDSLELRPDDPRIPDLSAVPIRYGVPGISAKVAPGVRALLEFAGGDPTKPQVTAWEPGAALQLDITTTGKLNVNAGGLTAMQPIARANLDTAGPWPIIGGNQSFWG